MALEVVAYISHPIRRKSDIAAVQNILHAGRKKLRQPHKDGEPLVRPIAPYLLHATVLKTPEEIVGHRIKRLTWKGEIPYAELHLYGDELCDAMRTEIRNARKCGIEVVSHGEMVGLLEEFDRQSARVAA